MQLLNQEKPLGLQDFLFWVFKVITRTNLTENGGGFRVKLMPPDENNTQTTPPLSTKPGPPPVTSPPLGTPFTPQPVQPAAPQPPFQPAAQQPIPTTTGNHAGFWIRLAALYLDFALVSLPVAILSWATALLAKLAGLGSLGITGILWIPALLVWIFFLYMVATHGATPGKMIFGMKIVKNGQAPGWGGALMREIVGRFVSSLILGIGYIMVAFTQNKRGLHDMIAGTEVVFTTPLGKGKKILAIVVLVLFLILPPLLMGLGVFSVAKFFSNSSNSSVQTDVSFKGPSVTSNSATEENSPESQAVKNYVTKVGQGLSGYKAQNGDWPKFSSSEYDEITSGEPSASQGRSAVGFGEELTFGVEYSTGQWCWSSKSNEVTLVGKGQACSI